MHTFLGIIFILLIAFGLIYIGFIASLAIMIWCYAADPDFWNRHVQPLLKDVRTGVDAGNKLKDYPKDRIKKLDGKYEES